jgi:ABC-type transporter Mla subunit MlaD
MLKILGLGHHGNRTPWDGAPHWAIELAHGQSIIINYLETLMSQEQDLDNAVSNLAKGYGDLHDAVEKETDALNAAMQNVQQPDPATAKAISDAISNITAITGQMATQAAKVTAAIPGATTVSPPQVTQPASPPTVTVPTIDTPPVTDPNATPPSDSGSSSSSSSPSPTSVTPSVTQPPGS